MNLEERMEKHRADLEAVIERAPRNFTPELLVMYRGWVQMWLIIFLSH